MSKSLALAEGVRPLTAPSLGVFFYLGGALVRRGDLTSLINSITVKTV